MRSETGGLTVKYLAVDALRPTEEVDPAAVARLKDRVERLGVWTHPILVERDSLAILDGHHRYHVARALGLKVVPAAVATYDDERLELSSWREDMRFFARDVIRAAEQGTLLPPKSTRHHLRVEPPRVALPIARLKSLGLKAKEAPTLPPGARQAAVSALYFAFGRALEQARISPSDFVTETPEQAAPHPLLRRLLTADPAMEALLPGARCAFSLSAAGRAPFEIPEKGLVGLGPHLLDDRRALAAAARWGMETWSALAAEPRCPGGLTAAFRHGASLYAALEAPARELFADGAPEAVVAALEAGPDAPVSAAAHDWLAARAPRALVEGFAAGANGAAAGALELSTEALMISGGDTRLAVSPETGLNRYGATARPRPEAVHFSSSTASSVAEHGFLLCDLVRRELKTAAQALGGPAAAYPIAVDALTGLFGALLGLRTEGSTAQLDVAAAPSGTDLELLAVAIARAQPLPGEDAPAPLTNILIAPEETGRGVVLAAAGRYFDDVSATGAAVEKGAEAWPGAAIRVETVAIRDADGAPRAQAAIDADVTALAKLAIAAGRRVLIHTLPSSKTGLEGPSDRAVARIKAAHRGRVDVVVDACQFRASPATVAGWVRRGWMVQVTGSKFLTGPPFSGAMLLPARLRDRATGVGQLLAAAPGVGSTEDWCAAWRAWMPKDARGRPNFGAVMRWLPALLEARMFGGLTDAFKRYAFDAFQEAVSQRLAESRLLTVIPPRAEAAEPDEAFAWNHTIVCFTVSEPVADGVRALSAEDCVAAFKLLNSDVAARLPDLPRAERALLRRPAHIGQPVTVGGGGAQPATFLRMVLGARYFNTIATAEPSASEAAMRSEIADAVRALDKLELIARHWARLKPAGSEG